MDLPISFADVEAAAQRLQGVAHRTPTLTSSAADAQMGAQLFFKCENLQRMGAFKFRGAFNACAQFTPAQRTRGVVSFSSGNHAQAIALAARLLQMPAVIVMPADASPLKVAATKGYGAEVVSYDRYREDREAVCTKLAAGRGMTMVPPFDHPHVMAGQGTAALELLQDVGPLDRLYVCVGGGGLVSGCAVAARRLAPDCEVIGVEPEAGNDVQLSLRKGEIVTIDVPRTIADGAQTQSPGRLTFAVIRALVADVLTVGDAQLVPTMKFFAERMKLVVEPTGCLAAAAALFGASGGTTDGRRPLAGQRIGVIISGGNIDSASYARLLAQA